MENNNNTFLAIGLSILVIVAWQYFYVGPRVESQQRAAEIEAQRQLERDQSNSQVNSNPNIISDNGVPSTSNNTAGSKVSDISGANQSQGAGILSRNAVIEKSQRVPLETNSLTGSINLKGARH